MRSTVLKDLLANHGVGQTHNRPKVSDDNPFSESEFRTMKYRPNYPGVFDHLEAARTWVNTYVSWYNEQHLHSGIALLTPDQGPRWRMDPAVEPARTSLTKLLRRSPRAIQSTAQAPPGLTPSSASTCLQKTTPTDSR